MRQTPPQTLMKQTGNKGRKIKKGNSGGGERRFDIWLLEFNKTLIKRNNDEKEVAGNKVSNQLGQIPRNSNETLLSGDIYAKSRQE